jgi:carboxymethylenebutenolidase
MSEIERSQIELRAADGARIGGYRVRPRGALRGGIVVVQEIFGVNSHIRSVADGYAAQGYDVIAPAFFDRIERGVELGYDEAGITKGRTFPAQLGFEKPLLDVAAAIEQLAPAGKVGVVGYCWGGTIAFLASAKVDGLSAAVGYYGGAIAKHASLPPRVPLLLHFGEHDKGIPLTDVKEIETQRPEAEIHLYKAGHGFNCDLRASYDRESATLALARTLGFFERHLA